MADWDHLAHWWLDEIADDPIYRLDVLPLAYDLLDDPAGILLDLGCGEGQAMRALPGRVVGTDVSQVLLRRAISAGPVVRSRLPTLDWLNSDSIDTAYAVLVLEHLSDLRIFESVIRVVKPGGALVVVLNHPAFTSAGAGPIIDQADGEILWRWGNYFDGSETEMSAGGDSVVFHHRPLGQLVNSAAAAGWALERLIEVGFSPAAIAAQPGYLGQEQMPRLLGLRWTRPATRSS